jgi:hypothetical protein
MTTRQHHRRTHVGRTVTGGATLLVAGLLGAGMLAACDGSSQDSGQGATASRAATTGSTTTGEATTGGATGTQPGTAPSATSGTSAGSTSASSSGPSPTAGSLRTSRCTADNLVGSLSTGDGAGAGSTFPYLVLKNTSAHACQLQGWPGVSFVGGDDGTQLGAAATLDRSSPHATVTLLPNGHAHAPLKIAQALNYDAATCKPAKADGLRVYVPGETHSIFVRASGLTACTNAKVHLLQTQAIQPGTD